MTATYEELRQKLLSERAFLIRQVREFEEIAKERVVGYKTHQADDATYALEQATNMALERHAARRLREIEDALRRFESGTYGVCEDCGAKINIDRLKVLPWTALCINCALRREQNYR